MFDVFLLLRVTVSCYCCIHFGAHDIKNLHAVHIMCGFSTEILIMRIRRQKKIKYILLLNCRVYSYSKRA